MSFSSLLNSNKRPAEGFYLQRVHFSFQCQIWWHSFLWWYYLSSGSSSFPSAKSSSGRTLVHNSYLRCPKKCPRWAPGRYLEALLWPQLFLMQRLLICGCCASVQTGNSFQLFGCSFFLLLHAAPAHRCSNNIDLWASPLTHVFLSRLPQVKWDEVLA